MKLILGSILWVIMIASSHSAVFTIGVEGLSYQPYSSVQSGQYQGYFREVLDKFAADNGHQFVYKPLPIKRLYSDFLSGAVDFKLPDNPNWNKDAKQAKAVLYSQPLTRFVDGVLVHPDNIDKTTLSKLGLVRGFTPFPYLDLINSGEVKVREVNDTDSLIQLVSNKRIDGGYINIGVAQYRMRTTMKDINLQHNDKLRSDSSDISLSTFNHPTIMDQFNQWLDNNSVWVNEVKNKYQIE